MSDDVDKTQERLELEETIRKQYHKESVPLKGKGHCLNCGEPLKKDLRWCDQHCRDDYEHRLK
jgi:hypothetical protein